ncbi:MAG TPA: hypothetical protein VEU47_20210 [Candidatus Cybelea sp.]|nr:hypothetical protein [Candidatus Cybelea sp.]
MFGGSKHDVCPRASILGDASQVVLYKSGEGRDVTDITYQGEVTALAGECEFSSKGKVINMTVTITLVATRGPAASGDSVQLPFFVSVIDKRQQRVMNKAVFESPIPFKDNRRRSGVAEQIAETINVEQGRTSADYEILVGLQLNEEQLEFNRKRRGSQ